MEMKRILKICLLVVVGAPLLIVLLIALLIFLGSRFAQTDNEIQSTLSKHSSTKEECISWLQSTNRPFSASPVAEDALPPGTTIDEIEGASSVIDVTFGTRGGVPEMFYGSHTLRCRLLYNEKGQLVRSRYESFYLGL